MVDQAENGGRVPPRGSNMKLYVLLIVAEIIDMVNFRVFAFKIRPSCSGSLGAGPPSWLRT